jgi:hypothetical protein
MGRWFGYREGYIDLFRLWMSEDASGWYGHIAEASAELREEIRWMQTARLKPIDFGLRVRAHPESLLITARNKMRHSQAVTRVISVSDRLIETPRLYADKSRIEANYRAAVRFLEKLAAGGTRVADNGNPLWTNVRSEAVAEFLESFVAHPLNVTFQPRDLANFIRTGADERLRRWDVVVPQGAGNSHPVIAGLQVKLEQRKLKQEPDTKSLLVSAEKMRVGSRGVEREGMTSPSITAAETEFFEDPANEGVKNVPDHQYRKFRDRPLLMVHFLEERAPPGSTPVPIPEGVSLCALGLSFPRLSVDGQMVTYRVNLVELRNMLEADYGADDEEGDDEDAD